MLGQFVVGQQDVTGVCQYLGTVVERDAAGKHGQHSGLKFRFGLEAVEEADLQPRGPAGIVCDGDVADGALTGLHVARLQLHHSGQDGGFLIHHQLVKVGQVAAGQVAAWEVVEHFPHRGDVQGLGHCLGRRRPNEP